MVMDHPPEIISPIFNAMALVILVNSFFMDHSPEIISPIFNAMALVILVNSLLCCACPNQQDKIYAAIK